MYSYKELCVGDEIVIVGNAGGCITTKHGTITLLEYNAIELNHLYSVEWCAEDAVLAVLP